MAALIKTGFWESTFAALPVFSEDRAGRKEKDNKKETTRMMIIPFQPLEAFNPVIYLSLEIGFYLLGVFWN